MKEELELLHDRYGRALFMCAQADGTLDKVMEELEILSAEWVEDKKFKRFFTHPLIGRDEKKNVIEKLIRRKKYCDTILDFLKVLIDNKRESLIHGVFLRYRDLYDEFRDRIRVFVETARLLTRDEKNFLREILTLKFREETHVEIKRNPELIGGISVKYRDRIYDYSIESQLRRLEENLTR